jgi:hypothetical protein
MNLDSTLAHIEKRKEDLRRAAATSEGKIQKFSEYLIGKIEKRREAVR